MPGRTTHIDKLWGNLRTTEDDVLVAVQNRTGEPFRLDELLRTIRVPLARQAVWDLIDRGKLELTLDQHVTLRSA